MRPGQVHAHLPQNYQDSLAIPARTAVFLPLAPVSPIVSLFVADALHRIVERPGIGVEPSLT